eukprot:gnl/MRDRNA2_/MRDRNA2_113319_c0_seq1.p1 gnl/MRDRNA2_/MRDRNA2_113319_c0~~gnl/MRDRNA2_/MRDRNA2_113319_c0_seq1.p1  ORF type:complete len:222 (-),score=28.18 gnl/MRDRNA2_/MRDRNA2_113319_c0_seq1:164-829(-)
MMSGGYGGGGYERKPSVGTWHRRTSKPDVDGLVKPDFVEKLSKACDRFLVPLSHNVYNLEFTGFKIRGIAQDGGPGEVLYENDEPVVPEGAQMKTIEDPDADPDDKRTLRYRFDPSFLDWKTIGTTQTFTCGDRPIHNFRMIERHYFRGKLLKSYDFLLPFVAPKSSNTWEVIYTMPELDEDTKDDMIALPWETRSDSFYFADGMMIMHVRAEYSYKPEND